LAGLVYSAKSPFKASFIADFSHRPQSRKDGFFVKPASYLKSKGRGFFAVKRHKESKKAKVKRKKQPRIPSTSSGRGNAENFHHENTKKN